MGALVRQLRLLFAGTVLVVAAFSTGIPFLFFLVYLLGFLVLGSYLYARLGLRGLRVQYELANPRAHVGDMLRATYRLENQSAWPKPWVEVSNDSTLPAPLPGRAIGIDGRSARQWLAKVTLTRRGNFRMGPVRLRTGDPFGFFTSEILAGSPSTITVFPRVFELPFWQLPPSPIEGTNASRQQTESASPLVRGIRPYQHGDALNRVHWLSSARHGDLQVKEFELEQAADLWIVLDMDRAAHAGIGLESSVETAVSAAASVALRTLADNRSVALTVTARRTQILMPDRGERVELKILHLLASVEADGRRPLSEMLLATLPRLRRGMTVCIITGSTARDWVRPLVALRRRGVSSVVVLLDRVSYAQQDPDPVAAAQVSAVRHALAEYGVSHYLVRAGDDLSSVLTRRSGVRV
jgi:uncharacterized protein (DUF58 family)